MDLTVNKAGSTQENIIDKTLNCTVCEKILPINEMYSVDACSEECQNKILMENTMSEIKLTKENAKKIIGNIILKYEFLRDESFKKYGSANYDEFKKIMIKEWESEGWIVKDEIEQAIEKADHYYAKLKMSNNISPESIHYVYQVVDYYTKVIELLQNKIEELEK